MQTSFYDKGFLESTGGSWCFASNFGQHTCARTKCEETGMSQAVSSILYGLTLIIFFVTIFHTFFGTPKLTTIQFRRLASMTSSLSPSAIHRIIFLVENDDRPISKMKKTFPTRWIAEFVLEAVNSKWKAIYHLYKRNKPAPPLTYLSSFELPLVLKVEVDDEDVSAIFAHGKPLEFWGCPRLFVSKIAEVSERGTIWHWLLCVDDNCE